MRAVIVLLLVGLSCGGPSPCEDACTRLGSVCAADVGRCVDTCEAIGSYSCVDCASCLATRGCDAQDQCAAECSDC